MKQITNILLVVAFIAVLGMGCRPAGGNHTGAEYMPDMAHSIAYEANYLTYYHLNQYDEDTIYRKMAEPRKPVMGTVPRGAAGVKGAEAWIPANGSVPYYYDGTPEGRLAAMAEITENPIPLTESGLAKGKELYNTFCAVCHAKDGQGNGVIVENGKYPAQPPNYLDQEFIDATEGRYIHAIMHGYNVMGAYKDKLSYEERWLVIHYIRSLQDEGYAEANVVKEIVEELVEEHEDMHSEETHEDGEHQTDDHGDDH